MTNPLTVDPNRANDDHPETGIRAEGIDINHLDAASLHRWLADPSVPVRAAQVVAILLGHDHTVAP